MKTTLTTELNIHRVVNITISNVTKYTTDSNDIFYYVQLTVTNENNEDVEISLFSKTPGGLKFK